MQTQAQGCKATITHTRNDSHEMRKINWFLKHNTQEHKKEKEAARGHQAYTRQFLCMQHQCKDINYYSLDLSARMIT